MATPFESLRTPYGWDRHGIFALFLAAISIILSGGLVLLPALLRVYYIAANTSCIVREPLCILVFGKKMKRETPCRDYRLRLDRTGKLLSSSKNGRVILMGGKSGDSKISEARAGVSYLTRLGIPEETRIFLEEKSCHTLDNLRNARDQFLHDTTAIPVLVTNRYHLARCSLLASSLRIDHVLCGAEKNFEYNMGAMAKILFEAFFIVWFMSGKIWASITGNNRMLARLH